VSIILTLAIVSVFTQKNRTMNM